MPVDLIFPSFGRTLPPQGPSPLVVHGLHFETPFSRGALWSLLQFFSVVPPRRNFLNHALKPELEALAKSQVYTESAMPIRKKGESTEQVLDFYPVNDPEVCGHSPTTVCVCPPPASTRLMWKNFTAFRTSASACRVQNQSHAAEMLGCPHTFGHMSPSALLYLFVIVIHSIVVSINDKYPYIICPSSADTARALGLLEEYCTKLRKPEEQQLKTAIQRVMGIFQSNLFEALLGKSKEKQLMFSVTGFCVKFLCIKGEDLLQNEHTERCRRDFMCPV